MLKLQAVRCIAIRHHLVPFSRPRSPEHPSQGFPPLTSGSEPVGSLQAALGKAIQFLGRLKDWLSAQHSTAQPTDLPRCIKVDVGTAYCTVKMRQREFRGRSSLSPARHIGIARVSSTDSLEDLVQVRRCLGQWRRPIQLELSAQKWWE